MDAERVYYLALVAIMATGLYRMFSGARSRRWPLDGGKEPSPATSPEPARMESVPGRRPRLLRRRFERRFGSRQFDPMEYWSEFQAENTRIQIDFHVERDPYRLVLVAEGAPLPGIRDLKIELDGEFQPVPFSTRSGSSRGTQVVFIDTEAPATTTRTVIELAAPVAGEGCRLVIHGPKQVPPDQFYLSQGKAMAAKEWHEDAVAYLLQYESCTTRNPAAAALLSRSYLKLAKYDKAESYAIQSMLRWPTDLGGSVFREALARRPPRTIQAIRKLQEEAGAWELEPHFGMVVLDREQRFQIGNRGLYLISCRELIEVRRPAMARFLRRLSFSFAGNRSWIPHTELRVIHRNGEVETVDEENFSVSDADYKNTFIQVEDEKTGQWILPDLEPGDVLEWSYHVLARSFDPRDPADFFILASVFDPRQPTFRAATEFVVPRDFPVRFSTRNGHLDRTDVGPVNEREERVVFRGDRFTPVRFSGFPYENNFLNPLVACAVRDRTWAQVAAHARRINIGENEAPDELPEPLARLVAGKSPEEGLESAFYWVRDTLKYAAFRSASNQVGKESRAAKILESGTGDCKDKSYLLALACRDLGIPCDYVAVSTDNGIVLEDLPGQQFDHVFLRAQLPDREVFLDGANSMAPFGSPPSWCQGMKAMVVDEAGTIINLPVDPPGANRVRIVETFDRITDGWLEGTFVFEALGHSGRQANEGWKVVSLSLDDPQRVAQESLRAVLPRARVRDHERQSDTGSSNCFRVVGSHWRSPLVPMGRDGDQMGLLFWSAPPIPLGSWRNMNSEDLFVLEFPLQVELEVEFRGDLFRRLGDCSRVDPVSNRVVTIDEVREELPDRIRIQRSMAFRPKYVRGEALADLEPSMEALERGLNMMFSFRKS